MNNNIDISNLYIIADFDHTITTKKSKSSWMVLENEEVMSKEDIELCEKYRNYYLPFENDLNKSFEEKSKMMEKWYESNLDILLKNKIKEEKISELSLDKDSLILRDKAQEFFKYTYNQKIPVIIISAGISNVIENFLKKSNCLYENVFIISNIIKFKDGIIKGFRNDIIHSLNKDKVIMPPKISNIINSKDNVILLGDNIGDAFVLPKAKNSLKIAFTNKKEEYKKYYDLIYDEEASFEEIIKLIKDID